MRNCPHCSTEIYEISRYCSSCGTEISTSLADTQADTNVPAPGKRRKTAGAGSAGFPGAHLASSDSVDHGRFAPGSIFAERYRIIGLLGRGGMGEVYRADDLRLDQPVALKFLPEKLAGDAGRLARFYSEVRFARQVSHPNVCRIYDIAQHDGLHFISMEYVDGEDLASLLRRIGRLPNDKAIEISRQLCAGLAAAHDRGVLHRDLKPSNVMIDGRGKVRIADFGLARAAEDPDRANVIEGTPAYMAPEQFDGKGETVRSDIYSLGLVLYEMFGGKPAFKAGTAAEIARLHQGSSAPSLASLIPDADPAVDRVIQRCLMKDPDTRPPSALAVAMSMPGGDPLAAALAAGETPSPEMVAAAGDIGGLQPGAAWSCLIAILAAILVVLLLSGKTMLHRLTPLEKSPDALEDRAGEIVKRLGYREAPLDKAAGLGYSDYYRYLREKEKSLTRWDKLDVGQPALILYWYRQSPRFLQSNDFFREGRVTLSDPPSNLSGMISVLLDTKGRLVRFDAVPPQVDDAPGESPAPEWAPLFEEAGLGLRDFKPAEPKWYPPVYADQRSAWDGVYPDRPDIAIHIEAAAARGKPVYFQVLEPWTRPSRMEPMSVSTGQKVAGAVGTMIVISLLVGMLLLTRRNLRLGRGDRRGAFRLSLGLFLIQFVAGALVANYVPDLNQVFQSTLLILGRSVMQAAIVWLLYIALEPHVRRLWPNTIISWSRLLAGNLRDPRIGKDILVGGLAGVGLPLLNQGMYLLLRWLGLQADLSANSVDAALGLRNFGSLILALAGSAVFSAILFFLLFFLLRLLLRREWLVASLITLGAAAIAMVTAVNPYAEAALWMLISVGGIFLLMRFGLVALMAFMFFNNILAISPLTTDFSAWYAGISFASVLILASLASGAFYTALAGRPFFSSELLRD